MLQLGAWRSSLVKFDSNGGCNARTKWPLLVHGNNAIAAAAIAAATKSRMHAFKIQAGSKSGEAGGEFTQGQHDRAKQQQQLRTVHKDFFFASPRLNLQQLCRGGRSRRAIAAAAVGKAQQA